MIPILVPHGHYMVSPQFSVTTGDSNKASNRRRDTAAPLRCRAISGAPFHGPNSSSARSRGPNPRPQKGPRKAMWSRKMKNSNQNPIDTPNFYGYLWILYPADGETY